MRQKIMKKAIKENRLTVNPDYKLKDGVIVARRKEPVIKISEVSRLLVNLNKWYKRCKNLNEHLSGRESKPKDIFKMAIHDVRSVLELRRRSREFVNPKRK